MHIGWHEDLYYFRMYMLNWEESLMQSNICFLYSRIIMQMTILQK